MQTNMEKRCTKCGDSKSMTNFRKDSSKKDGKNYQYSKVIDAHRSKVLEFLSLHGVQNCSGDIAIESKSPIQ